MVIGIIGESCVGKSTLALRLKEELGAEVITGRDYLRLAKSEAVAKKLFTKRLDEARATFSCDFVFSFNYFPIISLACKKADMKYVAWVYDNPFVLLYSYTII